MLNHCLFLVNELTGISYRYLLFYIVTTHSYLPYTIQQKGWIS